MVSEVALCYWSNSAGVNESSCGPERAFKRTETACEVSDGSVAPFFG